MTVITLQQVEEFEQEMNEDDPEFASLNLEKYGRAITLGLSHEEIMKLMNLDNHFFTHTPFGCCDCVCERQFHPRRIVEITDELVQFTDILLSHMTTSLEEYEIAKTYLYLRCVDKCDIYESVDIVTTKYCADLKVDDFRKDALRLLYPGA